MTDPSLTPPSQEPESVSPSSSKAKDSKSRKGLWIGLSLLVVLGLAYAVGYFMTGSRMPSNATVGGVDVGGKTPAEARRALTAQLADGQGRTIELRHGKKTFQIKPADVGMSLDAKGSIEAAGGKRTFNPVDMYSFFFSDHEHDLVLNVDDAKFDSALKTVGESVDKPVVEARITFDGDQPIAQNPKAGRVVAYDDLRKQIESSYLVSTSAIKVPTVRVEPAVDRAGLKAAMTELAEPAVSGPVRVVVGDKEVSLPVTGYAPALSAEPDGAVMKLRLDAKKLAEPLNNSVTGVGRKAVDATVVIRGGRPRVVPGKEGVGLQADEMATKLIPVLTRTGTERAIDVEAKVVQPAFTTADAKALGIKEKIGEFTTRYPHAEYRNVNQGRGAELINGTIVKPGETFSFNDTVGERTVANGFTTGTVINGGVFREELGGGVSQVVTTTYNAAFFGGMVDVEHHPHAFYIDRYPVGREATVYYGSLDLRFKNPNKTGVLIRAYVNKSTPGSQGEMHVELWGTKVYDKIEAGASQRRNIRTPGKQYDPTPQCVPQSPIAGFDIDIYRYFYKGGKRVKTETTTAHYQAADHVICGEKPKPKDKKDD